MIETFHLPTVNACLNSLCAIFLVIAYIAIKKKNKIRHQQFMLAAVGTSVLFLISYLTYHYQVGSMPYKKQGFIRVVYFSILISHTLLATAIVPMVITTLWRAKQENFEGHKKIARWTWPLWLYVSITGVLVYFFLYLF